MMNQMMKLLPRLQAAADFVRRGSVAADIGTDHAYLPVYLVQNGICPAAIGCDIGEGPLSNARQAVAEAGLSKQISLRLADGLDAVEPEEAQDIIIAGMGGETIAGILSRAPFCKSEAVRLILQPMTKAEFLRNFLLSEGYEIRNECAVAEGKRVYAVICAQYSGETKTHPEWFSFVGKIPEQKDEAARSYIKRQIEKLEKVAEGISKADPDSEQAARMRTIAADIRTQMR